MERTETINPIKALKEAFINFVSNTEKRDPNLEKELAALQAMESKELKEVAKEVAKADVIDSKKSANGGGFVQTIEQDVLTEKKKTLDEMRRIQEKNSEEKEL